MKLSSWAREPLLHFIALGAVLYVALTWGGTPPDPLSRVIKVGGSEKEKIAESWTLTMGRAPTDAELDQAIDAYVREEILYREALRLGLDEGDTVVRRRLVSKMDLSASLAAETMQPTDDMLRAFWEANVDRYADRTVANPSVSFEQIFFPSEAAASDALKRGITNGEATSLPASVSENPMREVAARFGQQFADELSALDPTDEWRGPMASGFGWHLVRLTARSAQTPDFESLRSVLSNDWRTEQIDARKQRAYEVLASAYRIDR
ncbi:MAG: peptidylprolyl isomerase [Pseudomonadota bacterium]